MNKQNDYIKNSSKYSSWSQNYQDVFALMCNSFSNSGTFIDIGCSTPENYSNVVLLLENGWQGIGFDLNINVKNDWKKFDNISVESFNVVEQWDLVNKKINLMPKIVDYLNIDVDGYPTQYVVENLNFDNRKFRSITIEHDAYRFGDVYKDAQRKILLDKGYKIVITTAAEDWYVMPELIEKDYLTLLKNIPEHMIYDHNVHDIKNYICFGGNHEGFYK